MLGFSWLVTMWKQPPCFTADLTGKLCYSDIYTLYWTRGLADGQIPYIDSELEYPVLTGAFIELSRRIAVLLGAQSRPGLDTGQIYVDSEIFVWVNALMLLACFVGLLWAHSRLSQPVGTVMIAVAPAIWTAGLINWDALVVMLTSLALLAWAKNKPLWCGIALGLGVAAKLYPVLVLVPLAVLCLRASRWRPFFLTACSAAFSWLLVNAPVYLLVPERWLTFWTFNVDRSYDFGSIWYVLYRFGIMVPGLSQLEALLMVVGTAGICLLLLAAKTRPRLAQGVFLLVVWFLVVNKVYSPQYVLWLLPLLVLARPRWLDWAVFSVSEALYWVSIGRHFDYSNEIGDWSAPDPVYALAVFLRITVQLWLCARVIGDILRPERDVVRVGELLEDPDDGLLNGQPDAPWLRRLTGAPA
ncbi:MAG: glycosyltransferase 87 family protein [Propionibacteriaceae bacterium]|jgi:uncharacterized membrane protein|nr:glycosyltransferase 87 family protein [Propionibacteriaceae bacterium]